MTARSFALPFVLAMGSSAGQGGSPAKSPAPKPAPRVTAFDVLPVESDALLQGRVHSAIARGEQWLVGAQGKRGSWQGEETAARVGYTELALYALAASGETSMGPSLERGLAFVRDNPLEQTYALSLLLLALDARAQPQWERGALPRMSAAERARYSHPRRLSEADRAWIDRTVDELLDHRFKGLWSYERRPGTGDVSNAQFALLGLRAAASCGAAVPPEALFETIEYFLAHQDDDGPPASFQVPRFGAGGIVEVVSIQARQRCWGYSFTKGGAWPDAKPPAADGGRRKRRPLAKFSFGGSGTHAAIGIASLQLARDEIERSLRTKPSAALRERLHERTPAIDAAIRDGLGWMAARWSLEDDPGGGLPYYYLYSVERVGALLNERFLAGHDWYREGAEILVRRQRTDGAWPSDLGEVNAIGSADVVNTAFALLFLRRATMPGVITPQLR